LFIKYISRQSREKELARLLAEKQCSVDSIEALIEPSSAGFPEMNAKMFINPFLGNKFCLDQQNRAKYYRLREKQHHVHAFPNFSNSNGRKNISRIRFAQSGHERAMIQTWQLVFRSRSCDRVAQKKQKSSQLVTASVGNLSGHLARDSALLESRRFFLFFPFCAFCASTAVFLHIVARQQRF